MIIDLVSVPDIDRVWSMVATSVAHCLKKAPMEIGAGDIWTNCRSGSWLLIIAHDGQTVIGTTIWRFSANGYFECVLLVGNRFGEWFADLISFAASIAKSNGCHGLTATGRPGLTRQIKKLNPQTKVERVTFAWSF